MEKLKEIKEIENKNKYKKKETDIKYENLLFLDFACENIQWKLMHQNYMRIQRKIIFDFLI